MCRRPYTGRWRYSQVRQSEWGPRCALHEFGRPRRVGDTVRGGPSRRLEALGRRSSIVGSCRLHSRVFSTRDGANSRRDYIDVFRGLSRGKVDFEGAGRTYVQYRVLVGLSLKRLTRLCPSLTLLHSLAQTMGVDLTPWTWPRTRFSTSTGPCLTHQAHHDSRRRHISRKLNWRTPIRVRQRAFLSDTAMPLVRKWRKQASRGLLLLLLLLSTSIHVAH